MRISHVSPRYFPAISGSDFYIQQLSEILQARNHKVKVFCSNALDFFAFGNRKGKKIEERYAKINGVDIFRSPIKYFPGSNLYTEKEFNSFNRVLKQLSLRRLPFIDYINLLIQGPFTPNMISQMLQDQTDIIHSVCTPFTSNLFAMVVGKHQNVPLVCTPFFHFDNPRYDNPSYARFLNKFDKILTCSQMESNHLIQNGLHRDKIQQIYMAIDPKNLLKGNAKKFRDQFNLQEDQKIMLFIGNKNFEKGAITILHSIKHVVKRFPNCVFVFIGPSTTAFNMTKKRLGPLRKNIINLGVVPYYATIKLNAFAAQDVYVMPSRSDAYGIAFLEAWINKKPVIGSYAGATPEIIRHQTDGLLVPFHSPLELAKAICQLLENEQEAQRLGMNGYQKIHNQTWENLTTTIEHIYEELIQNSLKKTKSP